MVCCVSVCSALFVCVLIGHIITNEAAQTIRHAETDRIRRTNYLCCVIYCYILLHVNAPLF